MKRSSLRMLCCTVWIGLLTLGGCGGSTDDKQAIIGTWRMSVGRGGTMTFSPEGTAIVAFQGVTIPCKYVWVDDTHISLMDMRTNIQERHRMSPTPTEINSSGNLLTLKAPPGQGPVTEVVYERVE